MVDDWVVKYLTGFSLKQIAEDIVSPVTVWNHLGTRGLVLRNRVDAQILAVTKHERKPFNGDKPEKAYMMGLRYGDLHVVKHGRAVRVRVSTTHPAMADLFESVFSPYGHVHRCPREAQLAGHEWTLECDLDSSFEFLLAEPTVGQLKALSQTEAIAFLAGLFDAEGSVFLHNKNGRYNPEASISNTDGPLLDFVVWTIERLGFGCKLSWVEQAVNRAGISGEGMKGQAVVWRFLDVQQFLRTIPIRHKEKTEKRDLVAELEYRGPGPENLELANRWNQLVARIRAQRADSIRQASEAVRYRPPTQIQPE